MLNTVGILAESYSALLHIRAGNIDFKHVNRLICKPFNNLNIILLRLSAHIDNNLCIVLP